MTPDELKPRLLIIDDNPEIHADFRRILCGDRKAASKLEAAERALFGTATGFQTYREFELDSAYQGEEGLARVYHALQEDYPYSIAFVDVRMPPGWDGIEVIPRLWVADPSLHIVLCTAYSDYTWEEIYTKIGSSDRLFILKKPFDRMEVLQLVHTLVERQSPETAKA